VDNVNLRYVVGSNTFLNALLINTGGVLSNGYGYIGYEIAGSNNVAIINGGVWSNRYYLRVGFYGAGNQLIVTNGGAVFNNYGYLGVNSSSSNNVAVVASGGIWSNGSDLYVGDSGAGNQLIVTNGGAVFNNYGYLGVNSSSSNNVATIAGSGAKWENRRDLFVGYFSDTNTLKIGTGGSVIASNAYVGFNAGSDGNKINITGGSLYVTNAPGTGTLDIRRGTLTASAGGSITANYLNISPTGFVSMTSSRISVSGMTTNSGTFTMLTSVGTFGSVVNSGAWITDPTTNVFTDKYIITASGYINASDDVYIFTNKSHFMNRSTNGVLWNTQSAKFLFNAPAGTLDLNEDGLVGTSADVQDFYAAGHNQEALAPSYSSTSTVTGDWNAATVYNFSLGTLEISNFSTVRVWDAFSGLAGEFGTNDGLRAALYVSNLVMFANSFLIISSNVEVYFLTSNTWGAANYSLLGGGHGIGGELHQFNHLAAAVPEPSVALLWGAGAATVYFSRRRQRRCSRASVKRGAAGETPVVPTVRPAVAPYHDTSPTGVVAAVPAAPVRTASKSKATPPARSSRRHRRHRRFYC
jgi:T5SS/PEP-CTERM-associated repeat protein